MSDDDGIQVPAGLTTEGLLGRRYLARFIDSLILTAVSFAIIRTIGPGWTTVGILLVLWVAYGGILESSPWQATIGKRVMGLRVYDTAGERLDIARAGGRSLVKDGPFIILGLIPAGNLLALVWVGAHVVVVQRSLYSQAIHDRVIGTWVAAQESTTQLRLT